MESSTVVHLLLCISLWTAVSCAESLLKVSSEDIGVKSPTSMETELADAVEDLLENLEARLPLAEKRGSIPRCSVGDRCAMRFGPRIGTLCDCGRVSRCNAILLKCI